MIFEITPEVAKKISELDARARRCLLKNTNPLLKDQTINTAFETRAVVVGLDYAGKHDVTMLNLILSCYPFKRNDSWTAIDWITAYHKRLWKHVESLIEGYDSIIMSMQMSIAEQDRLLKQLAEEVTERKLFLQFLKESHTEDQYAKWKESFRERLQEGTDCAPKKEV